MQTVSVLTSIEENVDLSNSEVFGVCVNCLLFTYSGANAEDEEMQYNLKSFGKKSWDIQLFHVIMSASSRVAFLIQKIRLIQKMLDNLVLILPLIYEPAELHHK